MDPVHVRGDLSLGVIGFAAVLNPGAYPAGPSTASVPGLRSAPALGGSAADPSESGVLTEAVSSRALDLWIDLVRPGMNVTPTGLPPTSLPLDSQQWLALGCLEGEGLTMGALARTLSVSRAVATLIADRLISAKVAVRYRDSRDRRRVLLVASDAGVQMMLDHRYRQVATLRQLLDQMAPSRKAIVTLAMQALAGAGSQQAWGEPGRT